MAWDIVGNVRGPQGVKGDQGLIGETGLQGVPGPAWPKLVKSADQANSTTTFANVTDLTFNVLANTTYVFRFVIFYTSAATTTALQIALGGPAAPGFLRYGVLTVTGATAIHNGVQTVYDTVLNAASGGAATPLMAILEGTLVNGPNAGTVALRMRSEVNASAVTILRGSYGTYG